MDRSLTNVTEELQGENAKLKKEMADMQAQTEGKHAQLSQRVNKGEQQRLKWTEAGKKVTPKKEVISETLEEENELIASLLLTDTELQALNAGLKHLAALHTVTLNFE